ncbi:MAG TPA: ATP-binding cassette domain-containing protein [Caldilineaceae bacterium]|nr:ATP-binding cassette domain-containing protein [Caldilineaceae bacterium]
MSDNLILVEARGLSKQYSAAGGAVQALQEVNLTVRTGEMVALVGPTGSGKTTLLALLAGLEQPDRGSVLLLGQPLSELNSDGVTDLRSQAVGFIYQNYNLFPGFTVRENIGLPLRLMLRPTFDAQQRSGQLLAELNLVELANRFPSELSGGQQQLVAVARALAANPPLILADEPTANLDSSAARQIVARLRLLADSGEHGVLLATHDLRTASQADRVLTLRDGRIIKETALQPGRATRDVLAELA